MKSGRKLLSIVIPAYNNPTYTRKTLKSIYAQTYRPIEIILVDDNSPKSLLKLYELFSCKSSKEIEITYIRNKSNLGPYFNLKKGISNAKGAYITIMPHDDWWIDKDFVRCAINNLESNFNCLAYISNSRIENTKNYMFENNLDLAWKLMNGEEYILKHFFSDAHPAYSGVVMNKSILDELHYLDYFMHMNNSIQSKIIPDECFL
jgi:glycosyltransferase involved in cell wall biosynthesis